MYLKIQKKILWVYCTFTAPSSKEKIVKRRQKSNKFITAYVGWSIGRPLLTWVINRKCLQLSVLSGRLILTEIPMKYQITWSKVQDHTDLEHESFVLVITRQEGHGVFMWLNWLLLKHIMMNSLGTKMNKSTMKKKVPELGTLHWRTSCVIYKFDIPLMSHTSFTYLWWHIQVLHTFDVIYKF